MISTLQQVDARAGRLGELVGIRIGVRGFNVRVSSRRVGGSLGPISASVSTRGSRSRRAATTTRSGSQVAQEVSARGWFVATGSFAGISWFSFHVAAAAAGGSAQVNFLGHLDRQNRLMAVVVAWFFAGTAVLGAFAWLAEVRAGVARRGWTRAPRTAWRYLAAAVIFTGALWKANQYAAMPVNTDFPDMQFPGVLSDQDHLLAVWAAGIAAFIAVMCALAWLSALQQYVAGRPADRARLAVKLTKQRVRK